MSKITSTKKLILEDYPADVRPWLAKLIEPLNKFLEQSYYALVQGLTIADNLKGSLQTAKITATSLSSFKVAWKVNEKPSVVLIAQIADDSGTSVPAHSLVWTYNEGQIYLTVNGLTAGNNYTIKILGLV